MFVACDEEDEPTGAESPPGDTRPAEPPPPPEPPGIPAEQAFVNPALRCAECHSRLHDQWQGSAHSQAARSPAFVAMRKLDNAEGCARCHSPLELEVRDAEHIAFEGVTCDTCHTISEVHVEGHRATATLRVADNVRYGPLCDAEDHYFHRMGCSPLHSGAELCASCHFYERQLPGGKTLPVYTEYLEWKEGPYAAEGQPCQTCHMPDDEAEVATGADERRDVSNHGFLGRDGRLRQQALLGTLHTSSADEKLHLRVELENAGAGHRVPSGHPGRQLVLRVRVLDDNGTLVAEEEKIYQRLLTDASGKEVPFFQAVRLASDNRIGPEEKRTEEFTVDAPGKGELSVELIWRSLSPELAAVTKQQPRSLVLLKAEAAFGEPRASGRRTGLPRRMRMDG